MTCPKCQAALDPAVAVCPSCGAPRAGGPDGVADWRQHIRETVQRRKEWRRRQLAKREDDARQLSIFADPGESDNPESEEELVRRRRAEIRSRVEEKLSRPRNRVRALVDAGEVAIPVASVSLAATAPELDMDLPDSEADILDEQLDEAVEVAHDSAASFDLASPGERLLSGFIDFGFLSLLLLSLTYLTTNLVAQPLRGLPGPALAALGCVGALIGVGYLLFFWSLSGQTLGKLLTSSRVVDPLGRPLGFGRAIVRALGLGLSILPLGAGFIGLWSDIERRAWHDRLADTKVVRI